MAKKQSQCFFARALFFTAQKKKQRNVCSLNSIFDDLGNKKTKMPSVCLMKLGKQNMVVPLNILSLVRHVENFKRIYAFWLYGYSSPFFIKPALFSPTSIGQVGPFINHPIYRSSHLVTSSDHLPDRLISLSFLQKFRALLKNSSISLSTAMSQHNFIIDCTYHESVCVYIYIFIYV